MVYASLRYRHLRRARQRFTSASKDENLTSLIDAWRKPRVSGDSASPVFRTAELPSPWTRGGLSGTRKIGMALKYGSSHWTRNTFKNVETLTLVQLRKAHAQVSERTVNQLLCRAAWYTKKNINKKNSHSRRALPFRKGYAPFHHSTF